MSGSIPAAKRIVYLVSFTAVVLLLFLLLGPIYETNDDPAMVSLLSGYFVGTPHAAPFLSYPASVIFMRLYRLAPGIPWYGVVFELITMLTALAWAALLGLLLPQKRPWIPALILLLTTYAYLVLRLNFMALTLSLFFVSIAWLWYLQLDGSAFRLRQLVPAVGVAVAYAIRPTAWPIMAFMAVPLLAVSFRGDQLKRLAVSALVAGALIATVFGANRSHASQPDQKTYWEYSSARSYLVDAPHEPTPEALVAADWSHADYDVAMLQWLHDEQVFSPDRIWEFIRRARGTDSRQKRLAAGLRYTTTPFHLLYLLVVILCAFAIDTTNARTTEQARQMKLPLLAAAGLWYMAGMAVLITKRFPPRVFVPLYLFFIVWAIITMPMKKGRWVWLFWPTTVLAALLFLFSLNYWVTNANARVRVTDSARQALRETIRNLPGSIRMIPFKGLYDSSATRVLDDAPEIPGNLILPSGWMIHSPAYSQVVESWGYASGSELMRSSIEAETLLWVIQAQNEDYVPLLKQHLQGRYAQDRELEIIELPDLSDSEFHFFRIR